MYKREPSDDEVESFTNCIVDSIIERQDPNLFDDAMTSCAYHDSHFEPKRQAMAAISNGNDRELGRIVREIIWNYVAELDQTQSKVASWINERMAA